MSSFKLAMRKRPITCIALVYLLNIFLFSVVPASGRINSALSVGESPVSQSATNGGGGGGGGGGDVLVLGGTAIKIALPPFLGVVLIVILYVLWKFCIKGSCSFSFTYTPEAQTEMTVLGGSDAVIGVIASEA